MFCVIYSFEIKPGETKAFEKAWRAMTILITEHEGGLGSRLHKKSEFHYIAYAQWPDKLTWKNSGRKLPTSAEGIRKTLKSSYTKFEILFELDVVDDLLK